MKGRLALNDRLTARREEIEEELLNRTTSIPGPDKVVDPEYFEGLKRAVPAALDYGLAAIHRSERNPPPIPAVLLAQARLAARNGISLDIVLRRYSAGRTLLTSLLAEEVENAGLLGTVSLADLLRAQGLFFDRLVAAIGEEYGREKERPRSPEQRRAEIVRGLLAGESHDTSAFRYEFDSFHVGAIARGADAVSAVKGLASALNCVALVIPNNDGAIWAWLGHHGKHDVDRLAQLVLARWPTKTSLAVGDPGQGMTGWRRTHLQAAAAFAVAADKQGSLIRYADYGLLSAAKRDELLADSLHDDYLAPIATDRDGGAVLRETLRAYFAANRNGASAAAALKVTRQTIKNRLEAVERRIGRPLAACSAELETALLLDELKYSED